MSLYITADQIGIPTGGGAVTFHESEALKSLGDYFSYSRNPVDANQGAYPQGLPDPFGFDDWLMDQSAFPKFFLGPEISKLTHFYAGTFSRAVRYIHDRGIGAKVSYTAAAHSIEESRKEHEALGIPYAYPHLTDPTLWERYVRGYLEADRIICPSKHSATVMRSFGADEKRIRIIPHGCDLPETVQPLPKDFRVGYLGAYGPDKGVRYLLEAWKKLNYQDATLVLAGRDSTSPFALALVNAFGGGRIKLMGWVDNIADFYGNISLYVQPSVSEGFGIEVLEALAYGRPVICSEGAGAVDIVPFASFKPRDVNQLVGRIEQAKEFWCHGGIDIFTRSIARNYTWDKIREQYIQLWRELLDA